jgi:hypothetical protein
VTVLFNASVSVVLTGFNIAPSIIKSPSLSHEIAPPAKRPLPSRLNVHISSSLFTIFNPDGDNEIFLLLSS